MDKNTIKYLVGCIGSRGVVIYISKTTTPDDLCYVGLIYIGISIQFCYKFFIDPADDNPVYLRPIHTLLYLAFAFYAIRGYSDNAWKILLIDLIFGVSTYTIHKIHNIVEAKREYVNTIQL